MQVRREKRSLAVLNEHFYNETCAQKDIFESFEEP